MEISQILTTLIESSTPTKQISLMTDDIVSDVTEIREAGNQIMNRANLEAQTTETLRSIQLRIFTALNTHMTTVDALAKMHRRSGHQAKTVTPATGRDLGEIVASMDELHAQVKQQVSLITLAKILQAVNNTIETRTN